MKFKRKHLGALSAVAVAGLAYAATQITVNTPFALSDGVSGDKPKMQRAGDGTLIVAYGDSPTGAGMVYDVKAQKERTARDIFVKTCKPDATKTCNNKADWTSPPFNVSKHALLQSEGTFDWGGTDTTSATGGNPSKYYGDIDKPNIKTSGPIMVLTWVDKYCPGGNQRAVRYLERDSRVIPFSCTWAAYSSNKGSTWSTPIQLSNGERDAIQDSSSGNVNPDTKVGQVVISWQEDPQGLQLGEADGPGDGASGANVTGGTDIWYTYANVDLSVPSTPANDFVLATSVRLSDNSTGFGLDGSLNNIFDGAGSNVPENTIEKGKAGASRANIGMVGSDAIVAYEETKGSGGLAEGKFIRYQAFQFDAPPVASTGCIISDPLKNARRVRFLTQSPSDAGPNGIHIAAFWKEGIYDKGGPSDIVLRRGINGLQPGNMKPDVDVVACATSDYSVAIQSNSTVRAENISSHTPVATTANLTDATEIVGQSWSYSENALAHRGVLRGQDLWVGFNYTASLSKMAAQLDNYNFWLRKFNLGTGWSNPQNISKITDMNINVREPRIFGTPKTNDATGFCDGTATQDATFCQNQDVVFLAWGTQTNVDPYDPNGPQDLGAFITVSSDAGTTFTSPVRLSAAQGAAFGDDEAAYETQPLTRPDGTRFYSVWAQKDLNNGNTVAEYTSGDVTTTTDPAPVGGGGGGCSAATGEQPFDPALPLLASLGLLGWGLRRASRS